MQVLYTYFGSALPRFLWLGVTCYLGGCAQPKSIAPPSFPYDQSTIEAHVLSPNGDLLSLDGDVVGTIVSTSTGIGQSPFLFMERVFSIIDGLANLEDTSQSALQVSEYALTNFDALGVDRYAITVEARANAWVEVNVQCGQNLGDDSADGGSVSLIAFASTVGGLDTLEPVGVAWGTASECELWDDNSDTVVDGDFAIILPKGNAPTLFKFIGTQSNTQTVALDYEGYATDAMMGIVLEADSGRFTVAISNEQVVLNDCRGQWVCDEEASRCTYTNDAGTGFVSSCPAPNMSEVTW